MSVTSLTNLSINQSTATAAVANANASGSASSAVPDGATTDLSGMAELLKSLEDLMKEAPSQFQSVTAEIASKLKSAAASASGTQGSALSALATQFGQVSQTGNLGALLPTSAQSSGSNAVQTYSPVNSSSWSDEATQIIQATLD